jgi:SAM-dependent methyltransferase
MEIPPSPWITRWTHLLKANADVLDVACGTGRHTQWFADHGHRVTGIDRDLSCALHLSRRATLVSADIENGPWPITEDGRPRQFDAVIVTNYLWRPLMPTLLRSWAPGGILLYETFAKGNETVGRPTRADFLLRPGELLCYCENFHVVAFEQGFLEQPPRFVQRIAAVARADQLFDRYPL